MRPRIELAAWEVTRIAKNIFICVLLKVSISYDELTLFFSFVVQNIQMLIMRQHEHFIPICNPKTCWRFCCILVGLIGWYYGTSRSWREGLTNGNTLHQKWDIGWNLSQFSSQCVTKFSFQYCTICGIDAILHKKWKIFGEIDPNSVLY